jgi:uncharacterized protein (TIGR02001 family)
MTKKNTPARIAVAPLPSALAAGILAGLLIAPAHAEDQDEGWWYGGSLALTSDYVYRGVTQTDESPAIQGSLDVGHSSGFYAGVWASNVDFDEPDGIDIEVNIYAGWTFEFENDTELDLQVVRYLYPDANPGFGFNYNELIATYSFLENYAATVAFSDDFWKSGESAFYYHLGAEYELGVAELNLVLGAGFNDVSRVTGSDYWDFQVGINRSFGMITADLSYFDTSGFDDDVQDVFGPSKWADARVVLTFSIEF